MSLFPARLPPSLPSYLQFWFGLRPNKRQGTSDFRWKRVRCGNQEFMRAEVWLQLLSHRINLVLAPSCCFAHVNIVFLSHKSPVLLLSPLRCLKFPGVSMISASLHRDTIRQHAALLTFETHHVLQIFLNVMCLLSLCIFRNILIFSSSPARFMCLAVQRNSLNRRVRSQTPADVG